MGSANNCNPLERRSEMLCLLPIPRSYLQLCDSMSIAASIVNFVARVD